MCISVLPVYVRPLELELLAVLSCHVDFEN